MFPYNFGSFPPFSTWIQIEQTHIYYFNVFQTLEHSKKWHYICLCFGIVRAYWANITGMIDWKLYEWQKKVLKVKDRYLLGSYLFTFQRGLNLGIITFSPQRRFTLKSKMLSHLPSTSMSSSPSPSPSLYVFLSILPGIKGTAVPSAPKQALRFII